MAESTSPIRNKGLLITAVIVGVIAAVLYNVQIYQVRKSFEAEKVQLIKVNRPLEPGEQVLEQDLEIVELDKSVQDAVGDVFTAKQKSYILLQAVTQPVRKGEWLKWSHVQREAADAPSNQLPDDNFTTFPLKIDEDKSLGDVVRKGDLIDVYAKVFIPASASETGKSYTKHFRVLEAVRVVNVGGESGDQEPSGRPGISRRSEGQRRWNRLVVQVRRDHYERLMIIEDYIRGAWYVGLLRRDKRQPPDVGMVTDPVLLKLESRSGLGLDPAGGADERPWR
jgi:Flp pilus assembly protein CpaB